MLLGLSDERLLQGALEYHLGILVGLEEVGRTQVPVAR
jgi:hypothetical protein